MIQDLNVVFGAPKGVLREGWGGAESKLMKKTPLYFSFLVGLLTIVYQIVMFSVRFKRINTDSSIVDYILFFVAGSIGGWILITFLNRQTSTAKRWIVFIAFLLATPAAMTFILFGGSLGAIGVLIFPQIPWAFVTWVGSLVGRLVK